MLVGYPDLAYQFGLADRNQAEYIYNKTQEAAKLMKKEQYSDAYHVMLNTDRICSTP